MGFFVKRDTEIIEGRLLTETNRDEIMEWCCGAKGIDLGIRINATNSSTYAAIGHWIVKKYNDKQGWHFEAYSETGFKEMYKELK